jgi:hypothetical protein
MSAAVASSSSSSASSSALTVTYSKPGQRLPTPSPGSGDRVFYESLFKEKGTGSPMALIWMIENGCFAEEEARRLQDAYLECKKTGKPPKSTAK